jgi:hypothetical protein
MGGRRFLLGGRFFARRQTVSADLMSLFSETFVTAKGPTKPKIVHFRPLAAVLNESVVCQLQAAGHEFYWSLKDQLRERTLKGWRLVVGRDAIGRLTVFMDRKEQLVLLHRDQDRPVFFLAPSMRNKCVAEETYGR